MPTASPPIRGDIAKALRLARGHTLLDVHAGAGIHNTSLCLIEKGDRPGKPHLHTLAAFLGVPADVLAGRRPALGVLREAAGITAGTLAAAVGITVDELAAVESGDDLPDANLTRKLARRLHVKPAVLAWTPDTEAAA